MEIDSSVTPQDVRKLFPLQSDLSENITYLWIRFESFENGKHFGDLQIAQTDSSHLCFVLSGTDSRPVYNYCNPNNDTDDEC